VTLLLLFADVLGMWLGVWWKLECDGRILVLGGKTDTLWWAIVAAVSICFNPLFWK